MKPFNLEEYLKNPSKKVVTRDRKAVKILCTNYESRQPIIAEIEGHDYSRSFTKDGRYHIDNRNSPYDLFFASEKHEGWINIYTDINDNSHPGNHIFESKEEAEEEGEKGSGYVTTIKIEWGEIVMKAS